MQKFLIKTCLFILTTVVSIEAISSLLLHTSLFTYNYYPGREIYTAIKKSNRKSNKKNLLIGDSVGNQIFNSSENHSQFESLATNQAISMAGQYELVKNYVSADNEIDTLFMVFVPWSFKNNLDQIYTYHYFLKPFNPFSTNTCFDSLVLQQCAKIPFYRYSQIPHIKISEWAPSFLSEDSIDFSFLSPISTIYLNKIKDLSIKKDFKVFIIAPPISEERKQLIEGMDFTEIYNCSMSKEFLVYINNFEYRLSSDFLDGTHLKRPEKEQYILNQAKQVTSSH